MRAITITLVCFAVLGGAGAEDRDGFGLTLTPAERAYVKDLKNNNGTPCCDDADGFETRIRVTEFGAPSGYDALSPLSGKWVAVGAEAVIRPNKLGVTRGWFVHYQEDDSDYVRCLLIGTEG